MVRAKYQDGRSTRVQDVVLAVAGGTLTVIGDGIDLRVPIKDVTVDERLGGAARCIRFPGGMFCEIRDLPALETLLEKIGHRDGWVGRRQRDLPYVVFALTAFIAVMAAAYVWLLPWGVEIAAHRIPLSVDRALSAHALKALDGGLLQPSDLPEERQAALTAAFLALQLPEKEASRPVLLFRKSPQLKANALTFPDGTIVMLDDLVTLMSNDEEILAVLGHELGHGNNRHSLQLLLRSSIVAAFWTFYIGDVSSLLATASVTMIEAQYSQDFEDEADDYGAQVLLRSGISPGRLADALQKLHGASSKDAGGGYLSSHPAAEDRIERLRAQEAGSK